MTDQTKVTPAELASIASRIKAEHAAVAEATFNVVQKARAVGISLNSAKEKVEHGTWTPWLNDNCGLSERTAQRYMQIASGWSKLEAKLTNEIRHGMADLSLNKAVDLITQPDSSNVNNDSSSRRSNSNSGVDDDDSGSEPTIFDKIDTRVDGIIKMLDRVKKKESVDEAISEVAKIIEKLEAKMTALSGEKTKQELKQKAKAA
jgi:hypothetical protein